MRDLSKEIFIGWIICLLAIQIPVLAQESNTQDTSAANNQATAPSKELLEFLAEFGAADDEAFEAIMHNGVKDASLPSKDGQTRLNHE